MSIPSNKCLIIPENQSITYQLQVIPISISQLDMIIQIIPHQMFIDILRSLQLRNISRYYLCSFDLELKNSFPGSYVYVKRAFKTLEPLILKVSVVKMRSILALLVVLLGITSYCHGKKKLS